VAYERGARRDGETSLDGLPRSRRRDLTRMLTLVPAGHAYHEWHELRSPVRCAINQWPAPRVPAIGLMPVRDE
jgi:AraC family transcriptional regulator